MVAHKTVDTGCKAIKLIAMISICYGNARSRMIRSELKHECSYKSLGPAFRLLRKCLYTLQSSVHTIDSV